MPTSRDFGYASGLCCYRYLIDSDSYQSIRTNIQLTVYNTQGLNTLIHSDPTVGGKALFILIY